MKYGRLKIIGEYHKKGQRKKKICLCSCGKKVYLRMSALISGNTKSCGCLKREVSAKILGDLKRTHGESKTPLYKTWLGMNERCNKKWSKDYKNYGQRGIKIEWNNYEEFRNDMKNSYDIHVEKYGRRNTTIERINVNGNYCKKNCRWATLKEQLNNTRKNRKFTLNGETKTISQWAAISGISHAALRYRLNRGLDIKTAISLKIDHSNKYDSI